MKVLLPWVAGAAFGLHIASASSQPTVQIAGQVKLTVNSVKTGDASAREELRDNASRLAFRGVEDLRGGSRALFGLEMGFNADSGTATSPMYRHSYVGLGGAFGTLVFGRLDGGAATGVPLHSQVQSIVDFAANDAGATSINVSMLNSRQRVSNAIGYASPVMEGFRLRARYNLRDEGEADSADSLDLAVDYAHGPFKIGAGYAKDHRRGGLRLDEMDDKWQAGARLALKSVAFYALYGSERYEAAPTSRDDVQYWLIGASWRSGASKLVLNLMERDVQASQTGKRKRWQVGYTYALSKRTELQAFIDRDGIDSSRENVRIRAIGAGVRHVF